MTPGTELVSGASFSRCGLYRYSLWRVWDRTKDSMVWLMLNPSTADAEVDDPTIRRCMSFARREGCGGIEVLNLYALRATKPARLLDHPEPEGPENCDMWQWALSYFHRGPVVAAWGAFDDPRLPRSQAFHQVLSTNSWLTLGRTKGGQPRHPLYVRADQPLVAFA